MHSERRYLTGLFSISYPQGRDVEYVNLRVIDEASGREFIEIQVSYEEFAKALSARYGRPCAYEIGDLDKIGLKHEFKTIYISTKISRGYNAKDQAKAIIDLQGLCLKYEIDGWVADADGAFGTQQPSDGMHVNFNRYIEVPTP